MFSLREKLHHDASLYSLVQYNDNKEIFRIHNAEPDAYLILLSSNEMRTETNNMYVCCGFGDDKSTYDYL